MALFHLHAAASTGFGGYLVVISDALMRPLHSDARWTLVLALIRANYLSETLRPIPDIPGASIQSDTQAQPKLS